MKAKFIKREVKGRAAVMNGMGKRKGGEGE